MSHSKDLLEAGLGVRLCFLGGGGRAVSSLFLPNQGLHLRESGQIDCLMKWKTQNKSIRPGKRCHLLFISDASSFSTQLAKLQDKVHRVKLYRLAKILI